jgi:hypothetical protein
MSYTPKHAKPASAKDVALNTYRGAFGTADGTHGRHVRHVRPDGERAPHRPRAGAGTGQRRDSQPTRVA